MKNKQIGWLIFVGALIWYYIRKVQAASSLLVRYLLPQNIRISKGALMWSQPVVITNPSGTPINLQRFNFTVSLEGYPIGTAYSAIGVNLNAAADTTVFADVVVPIDALISNIPALLQAGRTLDVRFQGHIFAELLTVPVDTVVKLPVPKIIK